MASKTQLARVSKTASKIYQNSNKQWSTALKEAWAKETGSKKRTTKRAAGSTKKRTTKRR